MIKISVITTVYNAENTIEDTIKSVINQKYDNFEYILIDAESSDNTLEIIKKYSYQDERVNFISEKDKGIYDGFNKGIKRATGEIIVIINADDFLTENIFYFFNEFFKSNQDCDILACSMAKLDEVNQTYFEYNRLKMNKMNYNNQIVHTPSVFYKSSVFSKVGVFKLDYKISSDYDFFCRCLKEGLNIKYSSKISSIMRVGGISDDLKFEIQKTKEQLKIGLTYTKEYLSKIKFIYSILKKTIKKFIYNLFIKIIINHKKEYRKLDENKDINLIFWFK